MYARPKPGETEEDILRLQKEFEKNTAENKLKPAATVISNKTKGIMILIFLNSLLFVYFQMKQRKVLFKKMKLMNLILTNNLQTHLKMFRLILI